MLQRMFQRSGTAAEWALKNPILGRGEIGNVEGTTTFKMGDGVTHWNNLGLIFSDVYETLAGALGKYAKLDEIPTLYDATFARLDQVAPVYANTFAKLDQVPAYYDLIFRSLITLVNQGTLTLPVESGYVFAIPDQNGRLALGITIDGSVVGKITPAAGSIAVSQLTTDLQSRIPGTTTDESGTPWAVTDINGRIALQVLNDGSVSGKFLLPSKSITLDKLATDVTSGLLLPVPPESGWALPVADQDGRVAGGFRTDGTFDAKLAPTSFPAVVGTPTADASYLVQPFLGTTGKAQLRSIRLSDGVSFSVGSSTKDNVEPRLTPSSIFYRERQTDGSYKQRWSLREGGSSGTVLAEFPIVGWGTSMMAGDGSNQVSDGGIPARIAANLGFTYTNAELAWINELVVNAGVGGSTSKAVLARTGAKRVLLRATGGSLPASGGVTVTAAGLTESGANLHWRIFRSWPAVTGSLGGIRGTLSSDNGAVDANNPVATFTRSDVGGAITAIPDDTPFISDLEGIYRDKVSLHWNFRNNMSLPEVQADMPLLVAYQSAYAKRFLIISELNGGEAAINDWLSSTYPQNYVDLKSWLINNGLAAAGITPTSQDTADIAAGVIPHSLRADGGNDGTHLSIVAYHVSGDYLTTVIQQKGWV